MDLLISGSLIASFVAGMAALFAPCCIGVLLPTYLGSIFKQKSTVFLMTFIYFLGLATIFVPIGLSVSWLSQLFSAYHNQIFLVGGIFLTLLGVFLLAGKQFSLPFSVHPELKKYDLGSVYVLGVFSAIATTCCAPVLAGVIALSALPGSMVLGTLYSVAYVMGMVAPLFLIAAFLDRANFTKKFMAFRKTIVYSIAGRQVKLTVANLFSGLVFLVMGLWILAAARGNQLMAYSSFQVSINIYLTGLIRSISRITSLIPEPVWAGVFLLLLFFIVNKAVVQIINLVKKTNDQ